MILSTGGACVVAWGMRGCQGACVAARGHAWLPGGAWLPGVCVVAGERAWLRGVCMVAGMCVRGKR